ncbi:MAG: hypothetical protein AMXMBFR82_51300 [Candidatus Hydrogenedentota bacterium]
MAKLPHIETTGQRRHVPSGRAGYCHSKDFDEQDMWFQQLRNVLGGSRKQWFSDETDDQSGDQQDKPISPKRNHFPS